ncbi:flagellar hook protein [Thioclava sp. BHET1]|nr:flagellar hook protein [Thioclava sp. BHET1]
MTISIYKPMSTLGALLASQNQVNKVTQQLQDASQEVSTGLKANVYADLGQGAAMTLELRSKMAQTDAYATSNTLLGNKMQVMYDSLSTVHDTAQSVLTAALANIDQPGVTAATIQQQAKAALAAVTAALNTSYAGDYVFGGTQSSSAPVQNYTSTNSATGQSPSDVMAAIVGSGPASATDAASMASQVDAVFNSTTGSAATNYEGTFYNGTPSTDGSGNPNARVTAVIGDGQTISYGIQANDTALKQVMQGLTMLASTDISQISDPDAYKSWMQSALGNLSSGVDGVTDLQAQLGSQQQQVSDTAQQQTDLKTVYNSRILDFEGVDSYEAASRFSALQTQLSATYQATATLSKLSILDYL